MYWSGGIGLALLLFVAFFKGCESQSSRFSLSIGPAKGGRSMELIDPPRIPSNYQDVVVKVNGVYPGQKVTVHKSEDCSDEPVGSATAPTFNTLVSLDMSTTPDGEIPLFSRAVSPEAGVDAAAQGDCRPGVEYRLDTDPPEVTGLDSDTDAPLLPVSSITWNWGCDEAPCTYAYTVADATDRVPAATQFAPTASHTVDFGDGEYVLRVVARDFAGNVSEPKEVRVILDTTPPDPASQLKLVVPSSSPGKLKRPVIEALGLMAAEGDVITLHTDATCSDPAHQRATLNLSAGDMTAELEVAANRELVTDGVYLFRAKVSDSLGNSTCGPATLSYRLDTTKPVVNVSLANVSPSRTQTWNWSCTDASPPCSYAFVIDQSADTTPTGAAGSTVSASQSSGEGTFYLHIQAFDAAGNASEVMHVAASLDNTAPGPTGALTLIDPASSPGRIRRPTIEVSSVVSSDTVQLYTDPSCSSANLRGAGLVPPSANKVRVTVTAAAQLATDGPYVFYARSVDPVGNAGPCGPEKLDYVLDTTAPVKPASITLIDPSSSPGSDSTPQFRIGGVAAGDVVTLYSSSNCAAGTERASGTVAAASTRIDLTSSVLQSDGTYRFRARSRDAAGNESACSDEEREYIFDSIPPVAASAIVRLTPSQSPANDRKPSFRVDGVQSAATVRLFSSANCDPASLRATGVVSAGGTSLTLSLNDSNQLMADGDYTFKVTSTDAALNVSACSSASALYTLDTTPPGPPGALTLVDPASSPGKDSTPTLQVTGVVAGDTLQLFSDPSCTGAVRATGVAAANTINLTSSALSPDGTFTFRARASDPAGNIGPCGTQTLVYTLDTTAPAMPSIALIVPSTSPGTDSTPTFRVSGVAMGDNVSIHTDSTCSMPSLKGSGTVAAGSTIDLTSAALVDGSYSFYAKSSDAVGNPSPCSTVPATYVLDTQAPPAPTQLSLVVPSSSPGNVPTPKLRIESVEAGSRVELYASTSSSDTCSGTALKAWGIVPSGQTFIELMVEASKPLAAGNHTFRAKAIDALGNASACSSASVAYVLDLTAPVVAITEANPEGSSSQTWSWSCTDASLPCTFRYRVTQLPQAAPTSLTEAYSSAASYTQSSGNGIYRITVQARDAAGNESVLIHETSDIQNLGGEAVVRVLTTSQRSIQSPTSWAAAIQQGGRLVVWGVGAGGNTSAVQGELQSGVIDVAATSDGGAVALKADGRTVAWGSFSSIVAPENVREIQSNTDDKIAFLKFDGSVEIWSRNGQQPGSPASASFKAASLSGGDARFAVLSASGSLRILPDPGVVPQNVLDGTPGGPGVVSSAGRGSLQVLQRSDGSYFALGLSSTYSSNMNQLISPTHVSRGVTNSALSGFAFAALRADGSVIAGGYWGSGGNPSLSGPQSWNNSAHLSAIPSTSSLDSNVVEVVGTLSGAFAALKSDGSVVTWGDSSMGGNTSSLNLSSPAADPTQRVIRIFAGTGFMSALRADGGAHFWGTAGTNGSWQWTYNPPIHAKRIIDMAADRYGWALLMADGSVQSLSLGASTLTTPSGLSPTGANLNSGVARIYASETDFIAQKADGSLVTWGVGQVSIPAALTIAGTNTHRARTVVANQNGAFAALKTNGVVVTWGSASVGGNCGAPCLSPSVPIKEVVANDRAFAAIRADGSVIAWGDAAAGGSITGPVVSQLIAVKKIVPAGQAFAALRADGSVIAWGNASQGGSTSTVASQLTAGVKEITANRQAFVALKDNGSLVAWGPFNYGGTLPASLTGSQGVKRVVATPGSPTGGGGAFAALRADGSAVTWGPTNFGGGGTLSHVREIRGSPGNFGAAFIAIHADGTASSVGSLAYGGIHSAVNGLFQDILDLTLNGVGGCAIRADGTAAVWTSSIAGGSYDFQHRRAAASSSACAISRTDPGVSTSGQLVSGSPGANASVGAPSASQILWIASNAESFAAVNPSYGVEAWGNALTGGSTAAATGSLSTGVRSIASTERAHAAIKADGTVVTWGDPNYGGQIDAATQNLINQ